MGFASSLANASPIAKVSGAIIFLGLVLLAWPWLQKTFGYPLQKKFVSRLTPIALAMILFGAFGLLWSLGPNIGASTNVATNDVPTAANMTPPAEQGGSPANNVGNGVTEGTIARPRREQLRSDPISTRPGSHSQVPNPGNRQGEGPTTLDVPRPAGGAGPPGAPSSGGAQRQPNEPVSHPNVPGQACRSATIVQTLSDGRWGFRNGVTAQLAPGGAINDWVRGGSIQITANANLDNCVLRVGDIYHVTSASRHVQDGRWSRSTLHIIAD